MFVNKIGRFIPGTELCAVGMRFTLEGVDCWETVMCSEVYKLSPMETMQSWINGAPQELISVHCNLVEFILSVCLHNVI